MSNITHIHARPATEQRINGWEIWQAPGGEWRVARIDANGDYLADETYATRRRAVRFAQGHLPPDLTGAPSPGGAT